MEGILFFVFQEELGGHLCTLEVRSSLYHSPWPYRYEEKVEVEKIMLKQGGD